MSQTGLRKAIEQVTSREVATLVPERNQKMECRYIAETITHE
jgi:hypothetical protein